MIGISRYEIITYLILIASFHLSHELQWCPGDVTQNGAWSGGESVAVLLQDISEFARLLNFPPKTENRLAT